MGCALSDIDHFFAAYLMDYAAKASSLLGFDIGPLLFEMSASESSKSKAFINETHVSQSCIFVFQCAMFKWLEYVGIHPSATLSHSLGEVAAAGTPSSDVTTSHSYALFQWFLMLWTSTPH